MYHTKLNLPNDDCYMESKISSTTNKTSFLSENTENIYLTTKSTELSNNSFLTATAVTDNHDDWENFNPTIKKSTVNDDLKPAIITNKQIVDDDWENTSIIIPSKNKSLPQTLVDDWHDSIEETNIKETNNEDTKEKLLTYSFDEMPINEKFLRSIFESGYERPSIVQQIALKPLLTNCFSDVIVCAQAGSGKTLLYVLAGLTAVDPSIKELQVLIIIPTKELGLQIFEYFSNIAKYSEVSIAFHRGIGDNNSLDEKIRMNNNNTTSYFKYGDAIDGKENIIIATPGRLLDLLTNSNGILVKKINSSRKIKIQKLNTEYVSFIGMDEADDLLAYQKRSSSRELIERIFTNIETAEVARKMAVTATCSQELLEFSKEYMDKNILQFIIPKEELSVKSLLQYYVLLQNEEKKLECLNKIFSRLRFGQAFIYTNTIEKAKYIYEQLLEQGFPIACIHRELSLQQRDDIVKNFKKNQYRIIVTTDLLARGIDIQSISLVINYDLPFKIDNYIHRVGRSGRFGKKGLALNLILNDQRSRMEEIKLRFGIIQLTESPTIDVLNTL